MHVFKVNGIELLPRGLEQVSLRDECGGHLLLVEMTGSWPFPLPAFNASSARWWRSDCVRADLAVCGSSRALVASILPGACRFDFFLFILHKAKLPDFDANFILHCPSHHLF
ncbi:MAG TPA: hypothetical protein VG105_05475 [Paraburkholderia sp.]|nr:hypothetical protein [Paraburkholderia sp.]